MKYTLADKIKAKIRNGEVGGRWEPADELDWLRRHPEDRPEGWTDPDAQQFDADLIPDKPYEDDRGPDELKPLLDNLDILDVYNRFRKPGYPYVDSGGKRKNIMVSCPRDDHADNEPSADIDLDKQVWCCHKCQDRGRDDGGDIYTLVGRRNGFYGDSYQSKENFPEILKQLSDAFGIVVSRTPGGTTIITETEVIEEQDEPLAPVIQIGPEIIEDEDVDVLSDIGMVVDWEAIAKPETFLWDWMHATTIDDLPHEYYFFLGLQALAAAAGPELVMTDFKPVYANLYLCLYGGTGTGKSRALSPFQDLVKTVLPYDPDPTKPSTGTKFLASPGSAEALVHTFNHPLIDPSTGVISTTLAAPVRGLLRIEEFASFVSRSNRVGNPMKETLIELYDAYGRDIELYARSAGRTVAHSPYCQVVTTTQPKAIHNYLNRSDADSGFMNRWIFAVGKRRTARIPHGGVKIDIDDAIHQLSAVKAWASTGREMDLIGDALDAWSHFFEKEIVPLYDSGDESMFSRMDLTLKKMILLLCANEKLKMPTGEIVEQAASLFPYFRATYRMFSHDVTMNDDERCQEAVIRTIKAFEDARDKGPSLRELAQRLQKTYPTKIIERSIQVLEVLDLIQVQSVKGTRGPATKRYTTNVG